MARQRAGATERDRARGHPGVWEDHPSRAPAPEPPQPGATGRAVARVAAVHDRRDGAASHRRGAGSLPDADSGGGGARDQPAHAVQQDPALPVRGPGIGSQRPVRAFFPRRRERPAVRWHEGRLLEERRNGHQPAKPRESSGLPA